MEKRLIDLETRFSFQEDSIETLSKLLANQQSQIDTLTRHIDHITTLLQKLMAEDDCEDESSV